MPLRAFIRLISSSVAWGTVAVLASVSSPSAVGAQGTVTGRVTLQEKPGQKTTDLGNAVVWLEPVTPSTVKPPPTKAAVRMRDRQFAPHVRVVPAGSSIEFPNEDAFSHNIFSTSPGSSFDLGLYGRGQTKAQPFSKVGAIPVYCNIHAKMTAFVVVVPTQWYAQAEVDGRWSIPDVPAGSYRVRIWHERAPARTVPVTVTASGATVAEQQLDARGFTLVQHKDKLGQDYNAPGRIRY
jgi:plastocyanin